jgi:iron complex transport system substrate-binding protein
MGALFDARLANSKWNALSSAKSAADFPGRIVCLTDETAELLYLLGEQDRIVGVTGYATRPPEVRTKPRVSAFANAKFDAILDLKPDLVVTFSDVQAGITRELVLRGAAVLNFNQRTIAGILDMITALSRLVGKPNEGQALVDGFVRGLDEIAASAKLFPRRPRVFFEEWHDPLIGGIEWVEELIEIAGGEPVFAELRGCGKAKDRVLTPEQVAERDPEVIIASWCGRKVNKETIRSRAGWSQVSAVRKGQIYEIKSTYILQPGPAALTDGVRQIHAILAGVVGVEVPPGLRANESAQSSGPVK